MMIFFSRTADYFAIRGSYPPFTGAVDVNNSVAAFMLIRVRALRNHDFLLKK